MLYIYIYINFFFFIKIKNILSIISLKSKEDTKAKAHIEKVFSIYTFQVCNTDNLHCYLVDMEVCLSPKFESSIDILVLPNNIACFLAVSKVVMKLVNKYN